MMLLIVIARMCSGIHRHYTHSYSGTLTGWTFTCLWVGDNVLQAIRFLDEHPVSTGNPTEPNPLLHTAIPLTFNVLAVTFPSFSHDITSSIDLLKLHNLILIGSNDSLLRIMPGHEHVRTK